MEIVFTPFLNLSSVSHLNHITNRYTSKRYHHLISKNRITCVKVDAATSSIMCEACNGQGWLLCDLCQGQKTNVKAQNNRIYRRCPSCRAIGYVLCSRCKVFKCVTFPDFNDSPSQISID